MSPVSTAIFTQPRAQNHLFFRIRPSSLQRFSITLVDRLEVSDKGFKKKRLSFVPLKVGILDITNRRALPEEQEGTPIETRPEEAAGL